MDVEQGGRTMKPKTPTRDYLKMRFNVFRMRWEIRNVAFGFAYMVGGWSRRELARQMALHLGNCMLDSVDTVKALKRTAAIHGHRDEKVYMLMALMATDFVNDAVDAAHYGRIALGQDRLR